MAEYNEELTLGVNIDASQAKADLAKLKTKVDSLFTTSGKSKDPRMMQLLKNLDGAVARADKLNNKLTDLSTPKETEEYTRLKENLEQIIQKKNALRDKEAELTAQRRTMIESYAAENGIGTRMAKQLLEQGTSYKVLTAKIKEAHEAYLALETDRKSTQGSIMHLEQTGQTMETPDSTAYAEVVDQLRQANNQIVVYNAKVSALNEKLGITGKETDKNSSAWARVKNAASKFFSFIASGKGKVSTVFNAMKNGTNRVKSAFTTVGNKIKSFFTKFKQQSNSAEKIFKKFAKTILRYGFNVRSLFFLIRRLRRGAEEGLKNLANFDPGANEMLSRFTTDILYLKNILATVLMPIVSVLIPIFRQITDAIAEAAYKLEQFFVAFTGTGTVYKAIRAQKDFAESSEKAANANKKSLAEYDKLVVVQKDNKNGSGSGDELDASKMFEFGTLEEKYVQLVEKLKQMTGSELGAFIATSLSEKLLNKDWSELGKKISNAVLYALELAVSFLENFDWSGLGEKIRSMLENINWKEIIMKVLSLVLNLFGGIGKLIGALIGGDLGEAINKTIGSVIEDIKKLVSGLWDIIGKIFVKVLPILTKIFSKLSPIITALVNVLLPIIEDILNIITDLLPILEPVLDFITPLIKFIGEVLHELLGENGLGGLVKEIVPDLTKCLTDLFTAVKKIFDFLRPVLAPIVSLLRSTLAPVLKTVFTILEKVFAVIGDVFDALSPLMDMIGWALYNIITPIATILTEIYSDILENLIDEFVVFIKDALDPVKEGLSGFKGLFDAIGALIRGDFKGALEYLKTSIKGVVNSIIGFLNVLIDGLNGMLTPGRALIWGLGKIFKADWKLAEVAIPHIPKLAQGAVLPANNPFLALVGDQKQGTNVETPLSTIQQAVREELKGMGYTQQNNQPIQLLLDGRIIAQAVWDENEKRYKQYGAYAY